MTAKEGIQETDNGSLQPISEAERAEKMAQLTELAHTIGGLQVEYKAREKMLEAKKDEFKKLAKQLGVDLVEDDRVKINLNTVDKSYLNIEPTIEFLRNNGFTKYIHTKEYFVDEEISLAMSRNEIKPEALAPFLISKSETRMTIKAK